MSNFNFYKAEKAYGELYLQFPRVMLYGENYSKLSDSAKIVYMIFRDRLQYSIKNNWIDKDNNVYFIFTNDELCELLNKSKPTAINIKKELVKAGLLLQKKMGFDPVSKKNRPNRLYLADLEVNATDIYQLQQQDKTAQTLDTSGSKDSLLRDKNNLAAQTLDTSESKDSLPREENAQTLDTSGSKDSLLNLYSTKAFKDYKEFKDQGEDSIFNAAINPSEKNEEIDKDQIQFYIEENSLIELYGQELINQFKSYSFNDFNMFLLFVEKLHYAQKSVEDETNKALSLFEWNKYSEYTRSELIRTFKKCIQQHRYGKTNSISNYLFISFKHVFEDYSKKVDEKSL